MKKSMSIISMGVLAASLAIPMGRAYADVNPPGNSRQRQELREDLQRLERLRQQRAREVRQHSAIGATSVNTTRRSATRRGKFVKTRERSTGITIADGIVIGMADGTVTDGIMTMINPDS